VSAGGSRLISGYQELSAVSCENLGGAKTIGRLIAVSQTVTPSPQAIEVMILKDF
jgi:hypothetical protein